MEKHPLFLSPLNDSEGDGIMSIQEKLNQALVRIEEKDAIIERLNKKIKEQEEYIIKLKRNAKGISGQ
jgi:hypothetical protein